MQPLKSTDCKKFDWMTLSASDLVRVASQSICSVSQIPGLKWNEKKSIGTWTGFYNLTGANIYLGKKDTLCVFDIPGSVLINHYGLKAVRDLACREISSNDICQRRIRCRVDFMDYCALMGHFQAYKIYNLLIAIKHFEWGSYLEYFYGRQLDFNEVPELMRPHYHFKFDVHEDGIEFLCKHLDFAANELEQCGH